MKDGDAFRSELAQAKHASLGHLLIRAARLFNEEGIRRVQALEDYPDLRAGHLAVFPHLDLDGTRLTELARRMGVTKQAASQLVDDLERNGVVQRRPDPSDGRAKQVFFTDSGRAAMLRGLSIIQSVEQDVTASFSPARIKRLAEDLSALTSALEALEP